MALRGDEQAFAMVYDRYAQRLLTYAYRRTGSAEQAEDVVSLVMLQAWRRRREIRFGSDGSMGGWLFRTAGYVIANNARAKRRHEQGLARIANLAPPVSADLDLRLLDDERLRRALDLLQKVSARDREVLELAAWSGLSESDMADAVGIPLGTMKSRLSRARRRLADRCAAAERPLVVCAVGPVAEDL